MRIRLKIAQFADGERFPMLLDESGVPLLHPTLFALTQLRARNLAANSISNSLRAIGLFYSFLETRQIDLEARLAKCQLLSLGEIEALVEGFRVRRAIEEVTMTSTPSSGPQRVFMERHRRDLKPGSDELVSRGWHATRLLYTRIYIEWLVAGRLFMPQTSESARRELRSTLDFFVKAINSRMPSASD